MGKRKVARSLTKLQVGDKVKITGHGRMVFTLTERRNTKLGVAGWLMTDSEGRARAFTDDRIT